MKPASPEKMPLKEKIMEEGKTWFKDNLVETGPSSREIEFEIPADVVNSEYDKIVETFVRRARIPGFRVGRAPRDIVRRTFASEIRERLNSSLVPRAVEESLRAHHLDPAVDPAIQNIRWEEGEAMTFRVRVDLWPDFTLPDYKAIKVPQLPLEVKEEEIEKVLQELQQRSAEFIPVTGRGILPGDFALIEVRARDLKTRKFWPTQKIQIEAGRPTNDPLLESNLTNLMPGETRTFTVDYPSDHANSALAGKKVEYTVRILALRERKIPEISDDFARSLGNFDNLDQLKEKIREELLEKKKEENRERALEMILEKLEAQISFSLPEAAIEEESQVLLNRWLSSNQGERWSEAELEALKAEARRQAEKRLKDRLILEKIAQKEGFEVTESEVEEEIRSLARLNRLSFFELKEKFEREGRLESVRHHLLLRKVVDFLLRQAL